MQIVRTDRPTDGLRTSETASPNHPDQPAGGDVLVPSEKGQFMVQRRSDNEPVKLIAMRKFQLHGERRNFRRYRQRREIPLNAPQIFPCGHGQADPFFLREHRDLQQGDVRDDRLADLEGS